MNTPVKCAKPTALGEKCYPSRGPAKHRKGPLTETDQNGAIGYRKGLYKHDITIFI